MQRYDLALQDIELAEENYPAEMMHKLKERSARCFLAKKSYENALNAFKWVQMQTIRAQTDLSQYFIEGKR